MVYPFTELFKTKLGLFRDSARIKIAIAFMDEMDKTYRAFRGSFLRCGRPRGEARGLGCKPRRAAFIQALPI
ncbi:protein of unassigned function [Methylobacterium oryzae CBMB20]|uniref:Protein of unassigned function n=1 Tax=Methylobacterium oryzae CBMB20 TaxID=693986 RepID=A0A089NPJ0_9HYPH|nr:protein of unassigned function [Methylobacterium oryzae CBMB20]